MNIAQFEEDTTTYLEMARFAMKMLEDNLKEHLDISNREFNRLKAQLEQKLNMVEGFDQSRALDEGWCILSVGAGRLEIQRDAESTDFKSDEDAMKFVMDQCDQGIEYHRSALRRITKENEDSKTGFIFMTLRSWNADTVFQSDTVKVGADYDPSLSPYEQDCCPVMGSNQDLVPLDHFAATPDITFGNAAFHFADMKVLMDPHDFPTACECGNCEKQFPIDPCTEENLMLVMIDSRKVNVAKCPHCGAIAHKPRKR